MVLLSPRRPLPDGPVCREPADRDLRRRSLQQQRSLPGPGQPGWTVLLLLRRGAGVHDGGGGEGEPARRSVLSAEAPAVYFQHGVRWSADGLRFGHAGARGVPRALPLPRRAAPRGRTGRTDKPGVHPCRGLLLRQSQGDVQQPDLQAERGDVHEQRHQG